MGFSEVLQSTPHGTTARRFPVPSPTKRALLHGTIRCCSVCACARGTMANSASEGRADAPAGAPTVADAADGALLRAGYPFGQLMQNTPQLHSWTQVIGVLHCVPYELVKWARRAWVSGHGSTGGELHGLLQCCAAWWHGVQGGGYSGNPESGERGGMRPDTYATFVSTVIAAVPPSAAAGTPAVPLHCLEALRDASAALCSVLQWGGPVKRLAGALGVYLSQIPGGHLSAVPPLQPRDVWRLLRGNMLNDNAVDFLLRGVRGGVVPMDDGVQRWVVPNTVMQFTVPQGGSDSTDFLSRLQHRGTRGGVGASALGRPVRRAGVVCNVQGNHWVAVTACADSKLVRVWDTHAAPSAEAPLRVHTLAGAALVVWGVSRGHLPGNLADWKMQLCTIADPSKRQALNDCGPCAVSIVVHWVRQGKCTEAHMVDVGSKWRGWGLVQYGVEALPALHAGVTWRQLAKAGAVVEQDASRVARWCAWANSADRSKAVLPSRVRYSAGSAAAAQASDQAHPIGGRHSQWVHTTKLSFPAEWRKPMHAVVPPRVVDVGTEVLLVSDSDDGSDGASQATQVDSYSSAESDTPPVGFTAASGAPRAPKRPRSTSSFYENDW